MAWRKSAATPVPKDNDRMYINIESKHPLYSGQCGASSFVARVWGSRSRSYYGCSHVFLQGTKRIAQCRGFAQPSVVLAPLPGLALRRGRRWRRRRRCRGVAPARARSSPTFPPPSRSSSRPEGQAPCALRVANDKANNNVNSNIGMRHYRQHHCHHHYHHQHNRF